MRVRVLIGLTGALLAGGFALAAGASAHVTVDAPGATQGGYTVLTFRVPTESDTLSTTGLAVQLPTDAPLASVLAQPHAGWTYTATEGKLATPITTDDGQVTQAVTKVEWKADSGSGIKPGQFDQFVLSIGPLPKVASMTFKVIQTYSDGSQVAWIELPAPGSTAEPEHPAPVLKLAAASASDENGGASTSAAAQSPQPSAGVTVSATPTASSGSSSSNTGPLVVSVIALVVAVVAAVFGYLTFVRGRGTRA